MRGWLRNASSQSASLKARHVSSEAASSDASSAIGLRLDEHVIAALNGDQITRDLQLPLAAGDTVAFMAADAGG